MARSTETVPRLSWDEFMDSFRWGQGEHVAMVGPTGTGKTTLAVALLPARQDVILFGTKPKDRTLDGLLRKPSWRRVKSVDKLPRNPQVRAENRIVFWPKVETDEDLNRLAYQLASAARWAFLNHNWCLNIDELWVWEHQLGLKRLVEVLLTQGRSVGITIVAGTQRPAHVTLLIYDQCTHLFFWRDNDERNLKRIAGLNGQSATLVRDTVSSLGEHECLYVNTRTGRMCITKAPAK